MFENRYKKAYDAVRPSQEILTETIKKTQEVKTMHQRRIVMKTAVIAAALFVCVFVSVPVFADRVPAFYQVIEFLSPALADRLVPIEKSSSSQGITMEVEAIDLQGKDAEIIISLRDDETSQKDQIHGQADLFDSYRLYDFANDNIVGGCSFLTYDEETGKAYFKVTVQSNHAYRADKLHFSVREIVCDKFSETRNLDISQAVDFAETKRVTASGGSGIMEEDALPDALKRVPGTENDPRPGYMVLDMADVKDCAPDDFTVTGMAYMDGVLRVQICMGDNWHTDRHVQLFLKNTDGEERNNDRSVSWHEDIGDTSYQFYEFWFLEDMGSVEDYSMYGIFHSSGSSVTGDWNVTFRVE